MRFNNFINLCMFISNVENSDDAKIETAIFTPVGIILEREK